MNIMEIRKFFWLVLICYAVTLVFFNNTWSRGFLSRNKNGCLQPSDKDQNKGVYKTVANATMVPPGKLNPADEIKRLWSYVYKTQYQCAHKKIFGGKPRALGDGGYSVCLEPRFWKGNTVGGSHCLVYSFGIGNDFSFDDKMAEAGCEVHSFDPSIELQDGFVRESGVVFHKIGISIEDTDHGPHGWKMRTLSTLLGELGHNGRYLDYLKVDTDNPTNRGYYQSVAGFEKETMQELLDTGLYKCVRQFALEIHLPGPLTDPVWLDRCRLIHRQLGLLGERQYRLFWVNENTRREQIAGQDPKFAQFNRMKKILYVEGGLFWEVALVNFDVQPCRV